MGRWDDVRRGAMRAEEAALLPALPRGSIRGSGALRDRIHAAQAISEKHLSNEVSIVQEEKTEKISVASYRRAALHHVLRK